MKTYKAVFFDWDGTAVRSRQAPAEEAAAAMRPLLAKGIRLVIVSGTTIENLAQGRIADYFEESELQNLYLGLGRGAYNYAYTDGKNICADGGNDSAAGVDSRMRADLAVFQQNIPDKQTLLAVHDTCFAIHRHLLERYDFPTDIVFTRPNYCKIDLMVERQRGESMFLQEDEPAALRHSMEEHGMTGGLHTLLHLAEEMGKAHGIRTAATCDAKYLEVGLTSKSDNVDVILERLYQDAGIRPEDCAFWGDEYVGIEKGIYGSDSFMITEKSVAGDFFDVSEVPGDRPPGVRIVGGGVERFLGFLRAQGGI